jgi:hypothetical protein
MAIHQNSNRLKGIESTFSKNGIRTIVLKNESKLKKFIYDTIPDNCIVGLGSSLTSSVLKIRDILIEKGNKVYFSWNGSSYNRSLDTFEEHPSPEFYLTSAELISNVEKLFNLDFIDSTEETDYPKHIIAFSEHGISEEENKNSVIDSKIATLKKSRVVTDLTLVILPFLKAS